MKLKKLFILIGLLSVMNFCFAQGEEEEPQMFGSKRTIDFTTYTFDQKIVTNVEHDFIIKNESKQYVLTITELTMPEGIGVFMLNKEIKPETSGVFKVVINPQYLPKGTFSKKIAVKTQMVNPDNGNTFIKVTNYTINGTIE